MAFLRTLRCHHLDTLRIPINPSQTQIKSILRNPINSCSDTSICNRPISISAQFSGNSNGFWTSKEDYKKGKNPLNSSLNSSIWVRPISTSAQFREKSNGFWTSQGDNGNGQKPLHALFSEAVGLAERTPESDSEETDELKKKLKNLEEEVRRLKERDIKRLKVENLKEGSGDLKKLANLMNGSRKDDLVSKPTSLSALFKEKSTNKTANRGGKGEKAGDLMNGCDDSVSRQTGLSAMFGVEKHRQPAEEIVYKELSPEMVVFASYLQKKGYFSKANFIPKNNVFDACWFENNYGRDFLKYAAEKFGQDNRDIAKWLSGSDVKKVAAFGCPSTGRKLVFSAKRLRTFFKIKEETVCDKCALKHSCKHVNLSVSKGHTALDLADVMRVITLYALDSASPELVIADEVKDSVKRLLEEVMKLGETPDMTDF